MKTKKSIWSIALALILTIALVLGLGLNMQGTVKADEIEHITFNVAVDGVSDKSINVPYANQLVVTYTVAENTGIDALQLTLSYDADAFTLVSVSTKDDTALGAATVNGANIVFDNVNTGTATGTAVYTATGDTLITATFEVKATATKAKAYNFGFASVNSGNEFSNAWRIVKVDEKTSYHTPVTINFTNNKTATVYIKGDMDFTLTATGKTYDKTAAQNSEITITAECENLPTLNLVWFVKNANETYTMLTSNPVEVGTYYVVAEAAASNYYNAYCGYTGNEIDGYTLTSETDKIAVYTITARAISVLINNQTSVYGDAIVSPLTYTIQSGEVLDGDVLGIELSTTATSSSNVGTYPITGAYLNGNYAVTFTKGTYTITKKAITITALNQNAAYTGSEPTVDQSKYSVDPEIAISGVVITKQMGVNVGTYTLTPSFDNGNYNVTLVNGTFTITQNALTQEEVDALVEAFAKFYAVDGTVQNELTITNHAGSYGKTYDTIGTYIGVVLENTAKLSNNVEYKINNGNYTSIEAILANFAEYAKTNAGVYEVKINFLPGYGYAFKDDVNATYTITLTIEKAELTITANGQVQYSDAETITVDNGEGWVAGEDYATYSTSAEALKQYVTTTYVVGDNAGTQHTVAWGENAKVTIEEILTNYDVTLVGNTVTVAKKVVNASDYAFTGYTGVYDDAEHALAVGSAENKNANFDIVDIDISSKSSVKNVADTGAYTATITLKNPNNYTFENGNSDGWIVDENGYAEAEKTAQVTITAAQLTINVEYTKTTATFTLSGFVGDDGVADLTNLAYLADGANTNINGNVYTINGYVANAITVSATSDNTNYTITSKALKNIVKVEYAAGQYDANKAGMAPVMPTTEIFFAGFTAEEPEAVALNHYTFVRFATDANNTVAFDFAQAVNENKVVYAIWEENSKYTLTLYYMVEGNTETLTKIAELQFYSDDVVNYNNLSEVAEKAWFKVQKWFNEEALETKFVDGSKLSGNTSIYANYKFNIGLGDVNANGKVNANDITLYRQWIVGGYEMIEVENGEEWATVNSQDFDAENTIYFVKRVADSNALTSTSLELGDNHLDIRDVSTIRMGMVGGYGFSIMEGKFVTGEELIVTRTVSANNASDLLILAKSGVAVKLSADITEEDFVGAIENASKDIIIDLNGHTITVKSLRISLADNNTGKIEIKNGRINVADGNGVHLSAPAGSIVLDNVTLYDRDGQFNLQAADHSLHFYNVVKFLKYNAQNENQPLAAEVRIEKDTHVVVEEQAEVTVEKLVVTENFVPSTNEDVEITLNVLGEQEIEVEGNAKNGIATLAELVDAAKNGGEYKLIDNIAYNGSVSVLNNLTLDLNGKTVESKNNVAFFVNNGAKLTINGNGNVVAQEACVVALDGSEVEINNGTFTAKDNFVVGTNGSANRGNNTITINGGVFNGNIQSAGYVACGIYVANNDTVIVNGGTFNITNGVGILARSGNTTVANGVAFNVTGNGTLGKVGDSKVTVPAGEVLVIDYAANYPGGTPVLTNNTEYEVYAIAGGIANQEQLLAAVANGGKYQLVADFTVNQTVKIEKDFTLDGNNHTITFVGGDAANKIYYAFLVSDESVGNILSVNFKDLNIVSTGYQVTVMASGDYYSTVNLNNVDITCDGESVYANGHITANVTDCEFNRNGEYTTGKDSVYYSALMVGYGAELNATNCSINSDRNGVATFPSGGTINLENTNITVTGVGYAFYSWNDDYTNYPEYLKDSVINFVSGNVTGGYLIKDKYSAGHAKNKYDAKIVIIGGTFNNDPTDYVAAKHYVEENNGVYTVKEYTKVATIDELYDAITAGGYIQLDADIIYSGSFAAYANTTINLNNHKLESVDNVAIWACNGATLTFEGEGDVVAESACAVAYVGSTIVINGGNFTSHDNFVIGTNGSKNCGENTIIINGGVFNGNIETEGYVACGIYVANNDTVVVNGGTFNITNGVGILARSGNTTVAEDVVFNVTGNGTLGKVGDSKVTVPAGEVLVVDYAANYPGGDPVLVNNNAAKVYALVDDQASFIDVKDVADTIVLGANIVLDQQIVVTKDLTLNLNGKTISNQTDIWSGANWSLISVQNGTLTVTGNGKMIAKENDCYAFDVRNVEAKLVIENGEFVGNVTAVYVHSGELEVNGGQFDILQKSDYNDSRYLLNCLDANYKNGTAKIVVNGGLFCEFDPSNNLAEGPNTAFVENTHTVTSELVNEKTIYTVA